jgi:hypothetical protein
VAVACVSSTFVSVEVAAGVLSVVSAALVLRRVRVVAPPAALSSFAIAASWPAITRSRFSLFRFSASTTGENAVLSSLIRSSSIALGSLVEKCDPPSRRVEFL